MIKKSLLIFLLLFAAYNLFLLIAKPAASKGQHQWQQNVIAAQEYVYHHQGAPVVIAGSSLSARMDKEMLPGTFHNISFSGGSIFTGLEILRHCEHKPKLVLIELNIILRDTDPAMTESIFRPVLYDLRKALPALEEKYQPLNILAPMLIKPGKAKATKAPDKALYDTLIAKRIRDYNVLPDEKKLSANINKLKEYMNELREAGCRVVLYTMPIDCKLVSLPAYTTLMDHLRSSFPEGENIWLPNPDCSQYTYNDGEHLSYQGAESFSTWFVREAKRYEGNIR